MNAAAAGRRLRERLQIWGGTVAARPPLPPLQRWPSKHIHRAGARGYLRFRPAARTRQHSCTMAKKTFEFAFVQSRNLEQKWYPVAQATVEFELTGADDLQQHRQDRQRARDPGRG